MKRVYLVKELAEARGITQLELYRKVQEQGVNVSLGPIQRIWQNHRLVGDPRSSTLIAIARALGVKVEDLYNDREAHRMGRESPERPNDTRPFLHAETLTT